MKELEKALDTIIKLENNRVASERWNDPDVITRIESFLGMKSVQFAVNEVDPSDDFDEAELDMAS